MRSKLLMLAAAVSAVLCVAAVGMWVRSEWVSDAVEWATDAGAVSGTSSAGRIMVRRQSHPGGVAVRPGFHWRRFRPVTWHAPPFRLAGGPRFVVILPYWFIAAVAGMLPASWLVRWFRRAASGSRRGEYRCAACGYDLAGTPERCPVCGVPTGRAAG